MTYLCRPNKKLRFTRNKHVSPPLYRTFLFTFRGRRLSLIRNAQKGMGLYVMCTVRFRSVLSFGVSQTLVPLRVTRPNCGPVLRKHGSCIGCVETNGLIESGLFRTCEMLGDVCVFRM